jgi:PAS domain-containing protein
MDALLVVAAIGGLAVGIAGSAFARRERERARDAGSRHDRDRDELLGRVAASEEELRSSRLILDSMQEGVALFDADGRQAFANPGAERHLGFRPASVEAILPLALRDAVVRARDRSEPVVEEAEAGSPSRSSADRDPDRGRLRPPRDPRRHRGPPGRQGAPRFRRERLARAEDPGRHDPGRG